MSDVNEIDVINKMMPDSVKQMISSGQTYKLAEELTGLNELSLEKISCYIGGRIMARHAKWRPVSEGLVALKSLEG
jgi:hypothetical protein